MRIITGFIFLACCTLLLEICQRPDRYSVGLKNSVFGLAIAAMIVAVITFVYWKPKKPTPEEDCKELKKRDWFPTMVLHEGSAYSRAFVTGYLMSRHTDMKLAVADAHGRDLTEEIRNEYA